MVVIKDQKFQNFTFHICMINLLFRNGRVPNQFHLHQGFWRSFLQRCSEIHLLRQTPWEVGGEVVPDSSFGGQIWPSKFERRLVREKNELFSRTFKEYLGEEGDKEDRVDRVTREVNKILYIYSIHCMDVCLTKDNVCDTLIIADLYRCDALKKKCLKSLNEWRASLDSKVFEQLQAYPALMVELIKTNWKVRSAMLRILYGLWEKTFFQRFCGIIREL